MALGMIFWILVILVLIILYVIHLRKCIKYFHSKTHNRTSARNAGGVAGEVPNQVQPFTISNTNLHTDIERGLHLSESTGCRNCCHIAQPTIYAYQQSGRTRSRTVTFNIDDTEVIDNNKEPPSYEEAISQDLKKLGPVETTTSTQSLSSNSI